MIENLESTIGHAYVVRSIFKKIKWLTGIAWSKIANEPQ